MHDLLQSNILIYIIYIHNNMIISYLNLVAETHKHVLNRGFCQAISVLMKLEVECAVNHIQRD